MECSLRTIKLIFGTAIFLSFCARPGYSLVDEKGTQKEGTIQSGSELDIRVSYHSSSVWNNWRVFTAGRAVEGGYWCSQRNDKAPLYWWILFKEKPVEIVEITFEEVYPGAKFEFFATNSCGAKWISVGDTARTSLLDGTQAEISGKKIDNRQPFKCYGLKITKLAKTKKYGGLASVRNFHFQVRVPAVSAEVKFGLRLINLNGESEIKNSSTIGGRTEIFQDGEWQKLCHITAQDPYATDKLAEVVCRMMGKTGYSDAVSHRFYAKADESGVSKYEFLCKGDEKTIFDCPKQEGKCPKTKVWSKEAKEGIQWVAHVCYY